MVHERTVQTRGPTHAHSTYRGGWLYRQLDRVSFARPRASACGVRQSVHGLARWRCRPGSISWRAIAAMRRRWPRRSPTSKIEAVIQLAAAIRVEESVAEPAKYYFNNTVKSLTVFDTCAKAGVKDFVFSSTAAVYGAPDSRLIAEDVPTVPGQSVWPFEAGVRVHAQGHHAASAECGRRSCAISTSRARTLRLRTGLRTREATHLIKVASEVAAGERPLARHLRHRLSDAGRHVHPRLYSCDGFGAGARAGADQAGARRRHAHLQLRLWHGAFGARSGGGVRQGVEPRLADARPAPAAGRCAGDRLRLGKLKRELGWTPQHASLTTIVETALNWERKLAAARS